MPLNYRPVVLVILDGFGIAPPHIANAISVAEKPTWDWLISQYPAMLLQASGEAVGLPWGQFGNSEVGHLNIGAGFAFYQNLPRISRSITTGEFFQLSVLKDAFRIARERNSKVHCIGLLGTGGVHAYQGHLEALISMSKAEELAERTFLHLFLDGRDTAKDEARGFMEQLLAFSSTAGAGRIASLSGRFYGMDRNKNWDRIRAAYEAITHGTANKTHTDPVVAITESYQREVYDEEFEPTVFLGADGKPVATIAPGDVLICFNFRADRMRQLTQAFTVAEFDKFPRPELKDLHVVTFTEYEAGLPVQVVFPPQLVANPIAKVFSDQGYKQLHVAETEKYAHVTFFINGMTETPYPGEDRILVPSPAVASYDEKPEMSANEVTDRVVEAIAGGKHDFYVVNYASPDMVAHTGNLSAAIAAVQTVDTCLSRLIQAVRERGGIVFLTADHGNAEVLVNPRTSEIDKEHNALPVPLVIVADTLAGRPAAGVHDGDLSSLKPVGILADVAPTILHLVGIPIPPDMNGTPLL